MSKMSKKIGREVVMAEQTKAPIISFEQALADGMFGYEIRAMAAALERKAKNRNFQPGSFVGPKENFDNAYHLRKLAKRVDEHYKTQGDNKLLEVISRRQKEEDVLQAINENKGIYTEGGHVIDDDYLYAGNDHLYSYFTDDDRIDGYDPSDPSK